MDLSGNPERRSRPESSLGNTKESHFGGFREPKQKEDVKLHGRLPDYDDSRCYGLGEEGILRQIDQGVMIITTSRHVRR